MAPEPPAYELRNQGASNTERRSSSNQREEASLVREEPRESSHARENFITPLAHVIPRANDADLAVMPFDVNREQR
jgi:hypothetical protein